MSYTVSEISGDKELVRKFLELPGRLYTKKEIMQQPEEERRILEGTHVLSHYFTVFPLLVLDERGTAVSRAVLTVYPEDPEGYLGFFESEDCKEAVKLLFEKAESVAAAHGCRKITGPVDASFWIRYRFKNSCFDRSYTGEPYNREYYVRLWQEAGYEIVERYYSNHYRIVGRSYADPVFSSRLHQKLQEGYEIKSPSSAAFDRTLQEVYGLLIELYRNFPVYKPVSQEEFSALYSYLKPLIRYSMVKMAYEKGKPVGFFISIPDYGNTVYGRLTPADYVRILLTRARPRSYVMLYMGVDASHRGLGKAMAEAIKEELQAAGVPSVGALIRQGNVNRDYFRELVDYEYEYVLLGRAIRSTESRLHTAAALCHIRRPQ